MTGIGSSFPFGTSFTVLNRRSAPHTSMEPPISATKVETNLLVNIEACAGLERQADSIPKWLTNGEFPSPFGSQDLKSLGGCGFSVTIGA